MAKESTSQAPGVVQYHSAKQRVANGPDGKRRYEDRVFFGVQAKNGERLAHSSQGSRDLTDARRGFAALCTALGVDPKQVRERVIPAKT